MPQATSDKTHSFSCSDVPITLFLLLSVRCRTARFSLPCDISHQQRRDEQRRCCPYFPHCYGCCRTDGNGPTNNELLCDVSGFSKLHVTVRIHYELAHLWPRWLQGRLLLCFSVDSILCSHLNTSYDMKTVQRLSAHRHTHADRPLDTFDCNFDSLCSSLVFELDHYGSDSVCCRCGTNDELF